MTNTEDIGIEQARATLGDLANRADYSGQVTYITRHGRRVAAIAPLMITQRGIDADRETPPGLGAMNGRPLIAIFPYYRSPDQDYAAVCRDAPSPRGRDRYAVWRVLRVPGPAEGWLSSDPWLGYGDREEAVQAAMVRAGYPRVNTSEVAS